MTDRWYLDQRQRRMFSMSEKGTYRLVRQRQMR